MTLRSESEFTALEPAFFAHPKREGLTICVPNWNHRVFLPRSLSSAIRAMRLLAAEGVPGEILVVDDASRDGSADYLFNLAGYYPDLVIRTILLDENRGPGAARNLGLYGARYKTVCLLDADNELLPENLSVFYRVRRETGAAVVYGNLIVREDGKSVSLLSYECATARVFRGNYIDNFSLIDAAQALACGGFLTDRRWASNEDWELFLHMLNDDRLMVFVPLVLGYYYQNPASLSADRSRMLAIGERVHRVYDQDKIRSAENERIGRMYHPQLGWII